MFSFTLISDDSSVRNTILLYFSPLPVNQKSLIYDLVALNTPTSCILPTPAKAEACWLYWFITTIHPVYKVSVQLLVGYLRVGGVFCEFDRHPSARRSIKISGLVMPEKRFLTDHTMIVKTEAKRASKSNEYSDYYGYIDLPTGQTPVLVLAMLPMTVMYELASAKLLFTQLYNVACWILRFDAPETTVEKCQVLNEMCTLIIRNQLYVGDKNEKNKPTEQFTCPGWFPDLALAGYDCEDGALQIMSLLYVLQTETFIDEKVQAIADFSKGYTACLTMGTLMQSGHAYVLLLDKEYLTGRGAAVLPTILLESTSYYHGVYTKELLAETNPLTVDGTDPSKIHRSDQLKTPMPVHLNTILYDTISTLFCFNFEGNLAHILVTQGTAVRAKALDVFMCSSTIQFEVLFSKTPSDELFNVAHLPPNYLPIGVLTPLPVYPADSKVRYEITGSLNRHTHCETRLTSTLSIFHEFD